MKLQQFHHGDIILKQIAQLPNGLTKVEIAREYILAEGETTGHKHRLVVDKPNLEVFTDNVGRKYFKVTSVAEVTHEEHRTITLVPGIYEVGHERERDPFKDSVRRVID